MFKCKLIVITHPELAVGFRLAGVDVESASNPKEAARIIKRIMQMGREYGIIAIDEDLSLKLDSGLIDELEKKGVPLLIPFPATEIYTWERVKREEDYTSQMIRKAIGYQIKLS